MLTLMSSPTQQQLGCLIDEVRDALAVFIRAAHQLQAALMVLNFNAGADAPQYVTLMKKQ